MLAYSYDYKKDNGEKTILLKDDALYYRYESKPLTSEELEKMFNYPLNPTSKNFNHYNRNSIHGMYYANEIIKEHKGTLSCTQTQEGKKNYVTFSLKLPIFPLQIAKKQ